MILINFSIHTCKFLIYICTEGWVKRENIRNKIKQDDKCTVSPCWKFVFWIKQPCSVKGGFNFSPLHFLSFLFFFFILFLWWSHCRCADISSDRQTLKGDLIQPLKGWELFSLLLQLVHEKRNREPAHRQSTHDPFLCVSHVVLIVLTDPKV